MWVGTGRDKLGFRDCPGLAVEDALEGGSSTEDLALECLEVDISKQSLALVTLDG